MNNLDTNYKKLISCLPESSPSPTLSSKVMERIEQRRYSVSRLWAICNMSVMVLSCAILVPSIQHLISSASQSGFTEYASLGISDGMSLAGSWSSFLMTMLESAPILETSIVVGLMLAATYSLKKSTLYLVDSLSHRRRLSLRTN